MQNITASIIQSKLHWEDPTANLEMFSSRIDCIDQQTDLIVLPEMFTTGFTMEPQAVTQTLQGEAMQWMSNVARSKNAVVAGSMAIADNDRYYNRFIWMQPDGNFQYYDKKHLFTYAGENKNYSPGKQRLIVNLKGWKIMPLICYDLRFAAWSLNSHDTENGFDYDCLLYVANWPEARSHAWRILLMARAIENQCYVIGVNRIGEDANQISYSGDSAIIDPKGENISNLMPWQEGIDTQILSTCQLNSFRHAFRPYEDWDRISII
jgi:omega-amidase